MGYEQPVAGRPMEQWASRLRLAPSSPTRRRGYEFFHRMYFPQQAREGVIIESRNNGAASSLTDAMPHIVLDVSDIANLHIAPRVRLHTWRCESTPVVDGVFEQTFPAGLLLDQLIELLDGSVHLYLQHLHAHYSPAELASLGQPECHRNVPIRSIPHRLVEARSAQIWPRARRDSACSSNRGTAHYGSVQLGAASHEPPRIPTDPSASSPVRY